MKNGSVVRGLGISPNWKPEIEKEFLVCNNNENDIIILSYPDGHLSVVLYENKQLRLKYDTQKIDFENKGVYLFIITWDENELLVYINGQKLNSYNDTEIAKFKYSKELSKENIISFNDSTIDINCKKWVDWRRERFKDLYKQPKSERIFKSNEEQLKELENAISAMAFNIDNIKNTDSCYDFLLPNLLSNLRALICWNNNKNNSPLLLRIAAFNDIPLPIYTLSIEDIEKFNKNQLNRNSTITGTWGFPCINQQFPKQIIVDLQEFLIGKIILTNFNDNINDIKEFSIKDFIYDAADTEASHYDTGKPMLVSILENDKFLEKTFFKQIVITISKITVDLGKFVLANINTIH